MTMVQVSSVILVGRWLDLYVMIFPTFSAGQIWLGVWEIGVGCGIAGLILWAVFHRFRSAAPVPARDPLLAESLHPSH